MKTESSAYITASDAQPQRSPPVVLHKFPTVFTRFSRNNNCARIAAAARSASPRSRVIVVFYRYTYIYCNVHTTDRKKRRGGKKKERKKYQNKNNKRNTARDLRGISIYTRVYLCIIVYLFYSFRLHIITPRTYPWVGHIIYTRTRCFSTALFLVCGRKASTGPFSILLREFFIFFIFFVFFSFYLQTRQDVPHCARARFSSPSAASSNCHRTSSSTSSPRERERERRGRYII